MKAFQGKFLPIFYDGSIDSYLNLKRIAEENGLTCELHADNVVRLSAKE